MRKYQPIWEQIKLKGFCAITADVRLHRRIIRMVSKEKDQDLGWKVLISEQFIFNRAPKLIHSTQGARLTFMLQYPPKLEDL